MSFVCCPWKNISQKIAVNYGIPNHGFDRFFQVTVVRSFIRCFIEGEGVRLPLNVKSPVTLSWIGIFAY